MSYLVGLFSVLEHEPGLADCVLGLASDPELARVLQDLNVDDTLNLASLLDVGAVSTDGKAHQVLPDCELV